MRIREIALVLPLAAAIGCSTSHTQGSRTARTSDRSTGAGASASADTGTGSAGASGNVSGSTSGTPSASGSVSTPGGTASGDTSTGGSYGSAGTSQQGGAYGSSDTSQHGSMSSQQGGASASNDVRAHSDDQVVSGKISRVSGRTITVTGQDGNDHQLQIAPETSLTVNGREDAQATDLAEGMPVRASFNTVGDDDVAVDVRAGSSAMDQSGQKDTGVTPGSNEAGTNTWSGGGKRSQSHDYADPNMNRQRK